MITLYLFFIAMGLFKRQTFTGLPLKLGSQDCPFCQECVCMYV